MTALSKKYSGVESMIIIGKNAVNVGGTVYAHFDSTELISGFGISSSNNYQFTLDHSLGKSFVLMGGTSVDTTSGDVDLNYQWYDETNSQFIGYLANLRASSSAGGYGKVNPPYRQDSVAVVLSSDFGGADITVSLRVISTGSGTPAYNWEPNGFETWAGIPSLTVLKT